MKPSQRPKATCKHCQYKNFAHRFKQHQSKYVKGARVCPVCTRVIYKEDFHEVRGD